MSNNRSDSSESVSIYETPITSPRNESVIDSTRLDSSLFSTTSLTSPVNDLLDGRQSIESVLTDSTLRQTARLLNSRSGANALSGDALAAESSYWMCGQMGLKDQSETTDSHVRLRRLMTELDSDILELFAIEQQIQSISLKCRSLRETIISKSNAVHSLMTEISANGKQTAQKHTQTDSADIASPTHELQSPQSHSYSKGSAQNSRLSMITDTHISTETQTSRMDSVSVESKFNELSEDLKTRFRLLPALVKGYLTRRLMKTEKVMRNIETIRETTQLLTSYHNLPPNKKITVEDVNFHKRLIIQLETSCHEFYDIFFSYPKSAQMLLITRSRQAILDRHYRTGSVLSNSSYLTLNWSQTQTNIELSSATKKAIQRKKNKSNESQSNSRSKKLHRNSSAKTNVLTEPLNVIPTDKSVSRNLTFRRSQRNSSTTGVHKKSKPFI